MAARLEIWSVEGRIVFALDGERVAIGSAVSNDVVLDDDTTISRLHAVFEPIAGGWCIRDLGSRNGTAVNGRRVFAEQHLTDGDEVRLGASVVVFRGDGDLDRAPTTETPNDLPYLTAREHDVLVAMCRPLLSGDLFTVPASIAEIAGELCVTQAAVKQHLTRLAEKFEVEEKGERRRARLANEAVERGAVTPGDMVAGAG